MTEHQVELEDLLKGYKTSQERGLTPEQAAANLQEFGTNELTPPPKTPEWVKFMDEMTGEFNLLLWAAGVACFVSYGMLPQADNLYLGVVLFCVVTFLIVHERCCCTYFVSCFFTNRLIRVVLVEQKI